MAATSHLTNLPVELMKEIADYVEPQDLCALRLVCRDVAAASYSRYISTYFKVRTHADTEYGLQTLVDITANKGLAKHIKGVVFVAPGLATEKYDPSRRFGGVDDRLGEARLATALLVQALNTLMAAEATPTICMSDHAAKKSSCFGLRRVLSMLGTSVAMADLNEGNCCGRLAAQLFTALTASHSSSPTLEIFAPNGLSPKMVEISESLFSASRTPFRHLASLTLAFGPTLRSWDDENLGKLAVLFSGVQALRHLVIGLDHWHHGTDIDRRRLLTLRDALPCGKLRSLSLLYLPVTVQTIIDFLSPLAEKLKRLTLSYSIIPKHECYSTLPNWLLERSHLDVLWISHLDRRDHKFLATEKTIVDCEMVGVSEIGEKLTALAQNPEYHLFTDVDGEDEESSVGDEGTSEEGE